MFARLITALWFYLVLITYYIILKTISLFYYIYIILNAIAANPALIRVIFPFLAKNKWVEQAKIIPDDRRTGNDVAISENTAAIIVSEKIESQSNFSEYTMHVYTRKSSSWKLQTKLFIPKIQFVAVDNDIILAANKSLVNKNEQNLPIHIFIRSNDTWSIPTQLKLPQPSEINFNIAAVALKADTAIFAVPSKVYVFRRQPDTNNWFYETELEKTGQTVAIDGNTIIIGGSKSVYIFVRDFATGNWLQQAEFSPMDKDDNSRNNVAICGNTAVVGRPEIQSRRGAVDVYERNIETDEWFQQNRFFPSDVPWRVAYGFGASIAIDNNTIVVGASRKDIYDSMSMQLIKDKTAAYVIERNTQTDKWLGPVKLLPKDYKQVACGYAREVHISGNNIIVTTPDNVYIFKRVNC